MDRTILGNIRHFLTLNKLRKILYNSKEYIKHTVMKERFKPTYKNIPRFNPTFLNQPITLIGNIDRELKIYDSQSSYINVNYQSFEINERLTLRKGIIITGIINDCYYSEEDLTLPEITLYSYYKKHKKIPIYLNKWNEEEQLKYYLKELTILGCIYDLASFKIAKEELKNNRDFWSVLLFRPHIYYNNLSWINWFIEHSIELTLEDKKLLLKYLGYIDGNKNIIPLTDFEKIFYRLLEIEIENQPFREYAIKELQKEGILKIKDNKYLLKCKKIAPPNYFISEDTIISLPNEVLDLITLIPTLDMDKIKKLLWDYCYNALYILKDNSEFLKKKIAQLKKEIIKQYYPHLYKQLSLERR